MDIPTNYYYMLTPVLVVITYLSAFKDGKPICKRYLVNCLLYLITSFSIYISSYHYSKDNIDIKPSHAILLSISTLFMIIGLMYAKNQATKHIIWLLILITLGMVGKFSKIKNMDDELIQDILKKLMVILMVCVSFAVMFPQYIKPSMGTALFVGLLFVIIFRIIDIVFLKRKYDDYISYAAIFIFSGFVVYDTDRVLKAGKECAKTGKPDYLENMIDMFFNVLNLFQNLANVAD